jgi:hypothetical protein
MKICQYGVGSKPSYETQNLPEMKQFIIRYPIAKTRIGKAADRMICAPHVNIVLLLDKILLHEYSCKNLTLLYMAKS